jgi:hypothetical protein
MARYLRRARFMSGRSTTSLLHIPICVVFVLVLLAACHQPNAVVDSSEVSTGQINPTFFVSELPDGSRRALAILDEWTGATRGTPRRVRLIGDDRLTVETEHGTRALEEEMLDDGFLQYVTSFAPEEGDQFTFVLTRPRTNERRTASVTFPAAIVTTEPAPMATLSLSGPLVKVRFTPAIEDLFPKGEELSVRATIKGPCVTQDYVALFGPDVTGPGFRAVELEPSKEAAPCDAVVSLTQDVFGEGDAAFGGGVGEGKKAHAKRIAPEVAVRIVP